MIDHVQNHQKFKFFEAVGLKLLGLLSTSFK